MDPFTLFGIAGAGLSIFGASRNNKALRRQAEAAKAAAKARSQQLVARLGRRHAVAQGSLEGSISERNVFGRSSDRLRLGLTSEALSEQAAIAVSAFIEAGNITAQYRSREENLFTSGLTGAIQGFGLAAQASELGFFGKSSPDITLPPGVGPNFLGHPADNPYI